MALGRRSAIDVQLRTLWRVGAAGEADDQSLLARYARGPDDGGEEAFRVLVERHGPMVLRVCRQVIGNPQDAEDATQAVFLVLARKATSIRVEGTVAPWLYGVARRVAARARGRAAYRREAEVRTAGVAASRRDNAGHQDPDAADWEMIHQEVDRLPEKYRAPIVLCYLQGQTYEQAARRIGCPVGTVRVRLSRARERLRGRLEHRGLGPERVTAVGWFLPGPDQALPLAAAAAGEPLARGAAWVEATVKAARALSLGRHAMAGTVPAAVLNLYESVVRAMMLNHFVTAGAWLLAAGMIGAGAVGLAADRPGGQNQAARAQPQPQPTATEASQPKPPAEPPVDLDSPETLRQHTDRRVALARQRLEAQRAYYEEGRITLDRYIDASQQLMLAETAASTTKDQRVAAAKVHLERIDEVVKRERDELDKGRGTVADVAEAQVARENAVIAYLEARQARDSSEVETLKTRIKALEKQLESLKKQLALPGTERN
jgi:RNA polymerase sigma factor (sigma-70 family)